MNDFFKLISPSDFVALFADFSPLPAETVPLTAARGRVLAREQKIGRAHV